MKNLLYLEVLPPEHRDPHGLLVDFFTNRNGKRIRFSRLTTRNPKARVVYTGGLSQPIECDYENLRDLAALGLDVYHLERFGEAGSERMYADPYKPAALPIRYFAQDLVDFVQSKLPGDDLPVYYLGSCYGGLVGLESCRIAPQVFTGLLLAAPMFGSRFYAKNGGEIYFASLKIGPHNETEYWGKANDWSPEIAIRFLERDDTTHDPMRGMLRHWWFLHKPELRLGGYTVGRIHQTAQGVLQLMQPGILESIPSRILIVSGTEDTHNLTDRHQWFAERLPNGRIQWITGACHGLWRESDKYRNQLLAIVSEFIGISNNM